MTATVFGVGVSCLLGGYLAAHASGPTSPVPLFYGGFLSQDEQPIQGDKSIHVFLYDSGTAGQGTLLCKDATTSPTTVHAGHFTVPMEPGCESQIKTSGAAWIELQVDGTAVGTRQPVGATPLAIAAETATTADIAGQVPFTGVTQISVATIWPGAVDYSHLTNVPAIATDPAILALQARVANLEAGPAIVGKTAPTTGDGGGGVHAGYAARRVECQTAFGAKAFVCSTADAVRAIARGAVTGFAPGESAWVEGADAGTVKTNSTGNPTETNTDCGGFTSAAISSWGPVMSTSNGFFVSTYNSCNGSLPTLCCSYP